MSKKNQEYRYTIKRKINADELRTFREAYWPKLEVLNKRYAPQIDISAGFPDKPEYLDLLRTQWLLDTKEDRPPFDVVQHGLGFGFGLLLQSRLKMRWHVIEDPYGECRQGEAIQRMNRTFLATALLAASISGCSTPETPTKKGPPSKATGNVTPPSGKSLNGENQMPISQDDSVIGFLQELFDVRDLKAKRQGEWLTIAEGSFGQYRSRTSISRGAQSHCRRL